MKLPYQVYYDRVLAGWLGKSLGGVVGAPFECHKQFNFVPEDRIWPDKLWPNDDLDIQVVWLEALQELGLDLTSRDLARIWKERCFYTCCEYGIFIDNYDHGVYPPLSGTWNNHFFHSSEGCPIRSEIWGFICPGNPELAASYAAMDGCLDHAAYSVELERFLSAAAALAFFERDAETLLDRTCTLFPAEHPAVTLYQGVKELCRRYPAPADVWREIVRAYGHRDGTKAKINNAFAFMALLLGKNDFKQTMRLCLQAGWDCDCTAATSGALLGALGGTASLPADWLEKLGKTLVCACEIAHQHAKLTDFAKETCDIGLAMAAKRNGAVEITAAPAYPALPERPPQFTFRVNYPETPQLFRGRPARVEVILTNTTGVPQHGTLQITAPEHLECRYEAAPCTLAPGASVTVPAELSLRPGFPMVSVNRCQLAFAGFTDDFGLFGTCRYQVYGPYWDMWDKEKYPICPYQNEHETYNPGNNPLVGSDATHTHVRRGHAYLDEAKLLAGPLPEEHPFDFESASAMVTSAELTPFVGACRWYLTLDFRARTPGEAELCFGSNAPYRCWLDGVPAGARDRHTDDGCPGTPVKLTGGRQRLVVALSTELDAFNFSFCLVQPSASRTMAVSPYYSDIEYY